VFNIDPSTVLGLAGVALVVAAFRDDDPSVVATRLSDVTPAPGAGR